MPDIPFYLRPLVGYAMWHLQRGESRDRVLELFAQDPRYGGLPSSDWNAALDQAVLNVVASDRLGFLRPEAPIAIAFAPEAPSGALMPPERGVPPTVTLPPAAVPVPPPPRPAPPSVEPVPPAVLPIPFTVGVRVYYQVELPNGQLVDASLTMNVPSTMSRNEVKNAAVQEAMNQMEFGDSRRPEGTLLIDVQLYQVIEGGLESPTLTL